MSNITTLYTGQTPGENCEISNQNFENINSEVTSHIGNKNNPHAVTKSQVGLSNVDNTSDINKPVSTLQQEALDTKLDKVTTSASANRVYAVSFAGQQTLMTVDRQPNANTLVERSVNGVVKTGTPVADEDATTKKYVDDDISVLSTSLTEDITNLTTEVETIKAHAVGDEGSQSITGDLTIVKQGTTSTGNLVVQGNLTVQGTTVTESQESLLVKDNMIVANADGASLTQLSGLAIKKNPTDVYGLVYDPTDDSVNLGLGKLDADNEFTFNDGEGLPVAVRAIDSAWTDGHLIQWDAATRSLKDGGAKPTSLPNPAALTFGTKTYNGSVARTILASDIDALTKDDADGYYQPIGSYLTNVPVATNVDLGGIKTGFSAQDDAKEYPVILDNENNAYVAVPWMDTVYNIASTEQAGIVKPGTTSGKTYGVAVASDGSMTVDVPWTDNNTVTRIGANGAGYTSGDINFVGGGSTSVTKTDNTVTITTDAASYSAGTGISITDNTIAVNADVVLTGGNQNIAGVKTFSSAISTAGITTTGNIMPDTNNTRSIGTSTNKFSAIYGNQVFGAVYNDYAEYREVEGPISAGFIVTEIGNDKVGICKTKKSRAKMFVVSDTYGFCIGEDKNSVPVAMNGRVLVYLEDSNNIKIGDYIGCSETGRGRKMSRLEAWLHPHRILGTVSSIPDYTYWGTDKVLVNNRVWVNLK